MKVHEKFVDIKTAVATVSSLRLPGSQAAPNVVMQPTVAVHKEARPPHSQILMNHAYRYPVSIAHVDWLAVSSGDGIDIKLCLGLNFLPNIQAMMI